MQNFTVDVFGAPSGDLSRIAVALRAVASRHDIALADVSPVDAEAAAVAATVWCVATGVTRFSEVPLLAPQAVDALSRILMRAAGRPVVAAPLQTPTLVPGDGVVAAVDSVAPLIETGNLEDVFSRAAADLQAGGGQLSAAAELLAGQVVLNR